MLCTKSYSQIEFKINFLFHNTKYSQLHYYNCNNVYYCQIRFNSPNTEAGVHDEQQHLIWKLQNIFQVFSINKGRRRKKKSTK